MSQSEDNSEEILIKLDALLEDMGTGKEGISPEIITITLKGDNAIMFRALIVVCKKDRKAEMINKMFMEGLTTATKSLAHHFMEQMERKIK